jgi:hypothetical protein
MWCGVSLFWVRFVTRVHALRTGAGASTPLRASTNDASASKETTAAAAAAAAAAYCRIFLVVSLGSTPADFIRAATSSILSCSSFSLSLNSRLLHVTRCSLWLPADSARTEISQSTASGGQHIVEDARGRLEKVDRLVVVLLLDGGAGEDKTMVMKTSERG